MQQAQGTRVQVYYNLRRKCFSVKALEGKFRGRVIAHADEVTLNDAVFKVSEAGRQRVLRERRKNVHAGVVGCWQFEAKPTLDLTRKASYNPYTAPHFFDVDTLQPVTAAPQVLLKDKKVFYAAA